MKYNILILGVIILFHSCSVFKKIKIEGEHKGCFSQKDVIKLIKRNNQSSDSFNCIEFQVIKKSKFKCIGLYLYDWRCGLSSHGFYYKVLRLEDEILLFSNDSIVNNRNLKKFVDLYSDMFSSKDIEIIKESFLEGDYCVGCF